MKAVIVGQMLNTNHANKISGGIQTVERLHVRLLKDLGYEVTFIGPQDSEPFPPWPDALVRIPSLSQEASGELTRAQKAALSKQSAIEIRDAVNSVDPDLIINHSFSSSHVRLAAELSSTYPTMCFIHNTPDTAMDIGVIAKVQHYQTLTRNGGALVCVSSYQRDLWRAALRKRLTNGDSFNFLTEEAIDQIYDSVVYPVYVEPQEVQATGDHFIVISRPDPIKAVDKLLDLILRVDDSAWNHRFPLRVYLAHPTELELNEFFKEKLAPKLKELKDRGWTVELHHNAPRQQLLDDLSTAVGCFVPCSVEASPVVFLEAATYGVPSIVFAKERDGKLDHAAFHMLDRRTHVNLSSKDVCDQLVDAVKLTARLTDRNRLMIADEVKQRHSIGNRLEELKAVISRITHRPKRETVLEF